MNTRIIFRFDWLKERTQPLPISFNLFLAHYGKFMKKFSHFFSPVLLELLFRLTSSKQRYSPLASSFSTHPSHSVEMKLLIWLPGYLQIWNIFKTIIQSLCSLEPYDEFNQNVIKIWIWKNQNQRKWPLESIETRDEMMDRHLLAAHNWNDTQRENGNVPFTRRTVRPQPKRFYYPRCKVYNWAIRFRSSAFRNQYFLRHNHTIKCTLLLRTFRASVVAARQQISCRRISFSPILGERSVSHSLKHCSKRTPQEKLNVGKARVRRIPHSQVSERKNHSLT